MHSSSFVGFYQATSQAQAKAEAIQMQHIDYSVRFVKVWLKEELGICRMMCFTIEFGATGGVE